MSSSEATTKKSLQALSLAALGIVFGDIGTSPLYAFEQVFSNGIHSVPVSEANIYGVLSLFFWSLMMVVSLKYVFFMMRADNHGEGGIMALMALAMGHLPEDSPKRRTLLVLGLIGASFFYGDGVITPAISVLSAVEGLELISPSLKDVVIPVALGILLALFWSQRRGTGTIGLFFGPVMLLWFVAIGALGVLNILLHPGVLAALNPLHAIEFLATHGPLAFFALGAVVLCLTGAEALYADMGHFGPLPIRIVWTGLVLPALVLNYFGQGALLLHQPDTLSNLFYMMAPAVLHPALIILATVATVIASQAVISGAFSMTRQAWQLGFLPHMRILQTAADAVGQIFVPIVNTLLALCVVAVILIFKSSSALGSAYGIAVTGTMLITDFLAIVAVINIWRWKTWQSILGASTFIVIDAVFFASNTLKLFDGGWLPLALSLVMIIVMTTWHRARVTLLERLRKEAVPITEFIANTITDQTPRTKGTGIYLLNDPHLTPRGLRTTMEHFGVIHEKVALLYVKYAFTPYVASEDRLNVTLCDKGFIQIQLNCGFMERVSITDELKAHWPESVSTFPEPASFFITQWIVGISPEKGMMHWRRTLYRIMFRNAQQPIEYLSLPIADSMIISRRIDL